MIFKDFEALFAEKIKSVAGLDDPAHDFLHFQRVVATAAHEDHLLSVRRPAHIGGAAARDDENIGARDRAALG